MNNPSTALSGDGMVGLCLVLKALSLGFRTRVAMRPVQPPTKCTGPHPATSI